MSDNPDMLTNIILSIKIAVEAVVVFFSSMVIELLAVNSKFELEVEVSELLGAETYIYTNINEQRIIAKVDARSDLHIGDKVELALDMNKVHFFDVDTELRIY